MASNIAKIPELIEQVQGEIVALPTPEGGAEMVSVREQINRINSFNPVEFLCRAMSNGFIETEDPETGEVLVREITTKQRLDVAKFLAGKVLPTMSLMKVMNESAPKENSAFDELVNKVTKGRKN